MWFGYTPQVPLGLTENQREDARTAERARDKPNILELQSGSKQEATSASSFHDFIGDYYGCGSRAGCADCTDTAGRRPAAGRATAGGAATRRAATRAEGAAVEGSGGV